MNLQMISFAGSLHSDFSRIFTPSFTLTSNAVHEKSAADYDAGSALRIAANCKIHSRCKQICRCVASNGEVILVAKSSPNEFGDTLYSIALPADPFLSKINSLTFSDALYSPADIFTSILRELEADGPIHSQDRSGPIISYSYDTIYKYDNYTAFLRPFQWGVSVLDVLRTARDLVNSTNVQQPELPTATRGTIAWALLECCKETEVITGSFTGTLSAGEFAGRMRVAGVADEAAILTARMLTHARPNTPLAKLGFAAYASRALKDNTAHSMRIIFDSPRLRRSNAAPAGKKVL